MDDIVKLMPLLALLAALIAFSSALLTFVNRRLNEAKTPEERSNILRNIKFAAVLLCCVLGAVAWHFEFILTGTAFFLVLPLSMAWSFHRNPEFSTVLVTAMAPSMLVFVFLGALIMFITSRLVDVQTKTTETLSKLGERVEQISKQLPPPKE